MTHLKAENAKITFNFVSSQNGMQCYKNSSYKLKKLELVSSYMKISFIAIIAQKIVSYISNTF